MNLPVQFQIVVFAVIAAIVLFQLYNVLGKRVGRQPQEDARLPQAAPAGQAPAVAALNDGLRARFDPRGLFAGAV